MSEFQLAVEAALAVLRSGGTVAFSGAKAQGLACDAGNAAAVDRLVTHMAPQHRPGFLLLLADERDVLQFVASPDLAVFDFLAEQTQPTTLVFNQALHLPEPLLATDGSVAIRLVADPFCRHLLKRLRAPLAFCRVGFSAPATTAVSDQSPPPVYQTGWQPAELFGPAQRLYWRSADDYDLRPEG